MIKAVLGVIGGSGIYDLPGLEKVRRRTIKSPWGEPSSSLRVGEIAGTPVVFLSRHDKGHRLSPSDINYRANIDVLKRAGVTDLVSLSACGSYKQELSRSEEHTSELQSQSNLVCRLLLEKKKIRRL